MPYTVNGVGTHVCGSRGDVGFNSYDAMEWVVVFFMPIIPLKAVHAFDWSGDNYRFVPIKWSFDLVFRTFFTGWNWGLLGLGCLFTAFGLFAVFDRRPSPGLAAVFFAVSGLFLALCLLVFVLLRYTGERTRNIRRVLGPHGLGSVDPALLYDDLVFQLTGDPEEAYGKKSYAAAVPELLERGNYHNAMWAARLAVAVEDPQTGEELTDLVLNDPDVIAALAEVKADPSRWSDVMLSPEERRQMNLSNIRRD